MTTVWRMDPVARLRRAAVAVRERGRFRLAGSEVDVPVAGIAAWLEASAAALEQDTGAGGAAAVAFAESLPLDIAHEPVVAARRAGGGRRTGTDLGCTCGDRFGVVSELAPSRGGREAALERHARHVRHTQGVDEADFQRAATERRDRQQAELRRLRETRPARDPFADRPWDRPAEQDWHVRVTGRLRTPATTVTSRHERHEYPAGTEFTLVMSGKAGAVPVLDVWSTQAALIHDVELFTVDSVEVIEVLEEILPWPDDTDFRLVTDEMRAQPREHAQEQG